MKLLLTTIAAVLVVGCGPSVPDISIHEAAKGGNIEAVKKHLAAGTDVNAKNDAGQTPLHLAALKDHKEIAELLITNGADLNAEDEMNGMIPLHNAAGRGYNEIVKLLIAKGADVNAKFDNGDTPLDMAIVWERTETADLLRKHGAKTGEELKGGESVAKTVKPEPPTAKAPDISIHDAVLDGDIEAVKQHIAAGTDVNAKDIGGYTSLHFAVGKGHKEIVELLIAEGADVNAKGVGGITPLHYTAGTVTVTVSGSAGKEIAELLIAKGADVNAKANDGWTPLHWAARNGHKEVVELLIAKGADLNAKDFGDSTPLDWAIHSEEIETADLLRKHGGKRGEELKAEGK